MKGIIKLNRKLRNDGRKFCSSCNRKLSLDLFSGNTASCKDCKNKRVRELKSKDPQGYKEKRRQYNMNYAVNQGLLYYVRRNVSSWKQASLKKKLPFDLTVEYVMELWGKQGGKCYYTGIGLEFILPNTNIGFPKENSPSLDRLIPEKGYTQGNVVWCIWWVNRMKFKMDSDTFYSRVQLIMEHKYEQ